MCILARHVLFIQRYYRHNEAIDEVKIEANTKFCKITILESVILLIQIYTFKRFMKVPTIMKIIPPFIRPGSDVDLRKNRTPDNRSLKKPDPKYRTSVKEKPDTIFRGQIL